MHFAKEKEFLLKLLLTIENAIRPILYNVPYTVPYTSPTRPLRPLQISPAWCFLFWNSSNEPSVMAELACATECRQQGLWPEEEFQTTNAMLGLVEH